ncbi:hypothetical protein C7H19_02320 [Aphanothece hegewaldii CCALA 016]|uniref:Uncharacterized protein n=1 Tax=Aphanothece hegewaldii CCALA 016 TaxID=2107694 RepID=A0A2T1M2E4_9CHRO|nr:hypothetical protein [Aphanothece hegewaldii]PSF38910.1 hypothetical protein C7H19_02320 [Aphanothece hegewaldii CCALA 016]
MSSDPIATFRISPLIRLTLLLLYISLTLPLPFLAKFTDAPISPNFLWLGIGLGLIALWGALGEKVILNDEQISVVYPHWFPSFLRSGWSLSWNEIKDLKLRTTGQGGIVYYFISQEKDAAYLLPMRVVGFSRLVKIVTEKTGIDTTDIRPLSQPWMYLILLIFTLFLLLIDAWTIWTATTQL